MAHLEVKTRFAPSPTGYLHVGGARTALFNWLYARRHGGTFLLRIEDTDRTRHVPEAVDMIVDDLRWLGLDWDEGYGVGGPNGPYQQSQRLEIYRQYVDRLLEANLAYYAFETPEELEAMRREARAAGRQVAYRRPAEMPTDPAAAERARAAGRPVVVRFRCPGRDVTVRDEVFGEVTVGAGQQEDFVILKDDGFPTYHLANVVDDHLMGVTLVMRGQEFLGQTWRQVLLREALEMPQPRYAHLPLILDAQGRKLSKRGGSDADLPVEVHAFRAAGYLPEALVSFLALLGWSPGTGPERLGRRQLIEAFSLERLTKANARFDRAKLVAFNTAVVAETDEDRLLSAFKDYLALNDTPIPPDEQVLRHLLRANAGFRTFADIVGKCEALFLPDEAVEYDPKAVKKHLAGGGGAGLAVLRELRSRLAECEWSADGLAAVIEGFCEEKSLNMGKVAQPLRVALTGRAVSPGIVDTLLLLGRPKALARIDRCLAEVAGTREEKRGDE